MNKQGSIDFHINRISILTKRIERVTNIVKSNKDSAKAIQAASIIVNIILQAANNKAQLMLVASQLEPPKDFKTGGVFSPSYDANGGEFIIPKQNSG